MGWIIHRHGALYAQEYGWDERFEALVAEIAAHFIQHLDPKCERCWIAERDGNIVGSVFLVLGISLLLTRLTAKGTGTCQAAVRNDGAEKSLVIVLINFIGPIIYFVAGRKDE